jgi:GNAT superfamily N-acetyltransferase
VAVTFYSLINKIPMSLYTVSKTDISSATQAAGYLTFSECADVELLSRLGEFSEEEARRRLANDNLAFVAYWKGEPAAFGWMARGKAKIGELNHEFVLSEWHRYLWNFRTLVPYRGLGIYPRLLQYIVHRESATAERFWIIHAPENGSSLRGILKAGFTYVGDLFVNDAAQTAIRLIGNQELVPFLDDMGIVRTDAVAASCWNCSSPFLKKRKQACCCSEVEKVCTINNLHAFAMN